MNTTGYRPHRANNDSPLLVKTIFITLFGFSLAVQAGQGPQPTICARSCWGARSASGCSTMSALTRFIVHHTASTGHWNTTSQATSAANVRGLQNYDMDVEGFCDIEYHWMIDKLGNIFEARYGGMTGQLIRGAHDAVNSNSHGGSLMGYFHPPYNHVAPAVMLNQLYALIAWRMPSAWSPYGSGSYGGKTVGFLDGHRKAFTTSCPGDNIHPPLITEDYFGGTMRNEVNARKNGGGGGSVPAGRIDVFVRSSGNQLLHKWFDGTAWYGGWENLGGNITSDPAAVSWGPNHIDVFARGAAGDLQHRGFDNGVWYPWESLGGGVVGSPDVASWGVGRLDVFVRGTNNKLYTRYYDLGAGGWGTWTLLDMMDLNADVTAASWGPGRIDVFTRGADATLYHKGYVGGSWYPWDSQGGGLVGGPDVATWASDRLDVVARGTDNQCWHKAWAGTFWGPWEPMGNSLTADPSAVSSAVNRLDIFGRGADGSLQHKWWDGVNWSGWENLGTGFVGGPDACSWTGN